MVDALGWRMKFGVIVPSTNTAVQPEFDAMRPRGVTNHFARIHIPNDPLRGDADFTKLIEIVRDELMAAIDRVMTCEPDHLIMGMSSETFWDGLEEARGCVSASKRMPGSRSRWALMRRAKPCANTATSNALAS
jgi:maleate isomerase